MKYTYLIFIILTVVLACPKKDSESHKDHLCAEEFTWDEDGVVYKIIHDIDTVWKDEYALPVKNLYLVRFHVLPGVYDSSILFNVEYKYVSLDYGEYVCWRYKFENYPLRFKYFIDHPEVNNEVIFNVNARFTLNDTIVVNLKDYIN
ncbi:MAG: hypothetical protein R6X28_05620 [Bacteroidales bacterium]